MLEDNGIKHKWLHIPLTTRVMLDMAIYISYASQQDIVQISWSVG